MTQLDAHGITIHRKDSVVETVHYEGREMSLMVSGDGTEIIRLRLELGARWMMGPTENWSALEYLHVNYGQLRWILETGDVILHPGDSVSACPILQDAIFVAEENTECIYISSQPVFHLFSDVVRNMTTLAVSIEEKDGYTADHCSRIMKLSMMVGVKLNLSVSELHALNLGAFFHDIGKVRVPDKVLLKPGALTDEEWDIMKLHSTYGREILEETGLDSLKLAALIVEQHHERYNGTGYPHQLKGEDISLGASIVAVVDSFDAMTTDRIYRKGMTAAAAIEELVACRGSLYHPDVVDAFVSISDELSE